MELIDHCLAAWMSCIETFESTVVSGAAGSGTSSADGDCTARMVGPGLVDCRMCCVAMLNIVPYTGLALKMPVVAVAT